ncbi:MAG TPA: CDP-alcohol phosphatidyltransferase family protein [Blastocatellia bacterium]|jgi:CDP-diacylglycerol--glycerol-3-phosphate 3-phosphatidyltransferase|nr:CDP-alcohol phosphatidyltransferase family protein [Blastocatellia bacterium]
MISEAIGVGSKRIIDAIVRALARSHTNPNLLTFFGLLVNIGCGVLYGYGRFVAAGLLLIFAALLDILDGQVARHRGRVTRFGAFFDSVLDRYSDIIVYVGIMVFYARAHAQQSMLLVTVTGLALVGSVLVSYSRARAESLSIPCKVGFLERPERLVLLIIGSLTSVGEMSNPLLHKMPQVLWVLAVLSHWTVVHRIYHTWLLSKEPAPAVNAATEKVEDPNNREKFIGAGYSVSN